MSSLTESPQSVKPTRASTVERKICDLYAANKTIPAISAKTGKSRGFIFKVLHKHQVPLRRGTQVGRKTTFGPEFEQQVKEMYLAKKSCIQISLETGIEKSTVLKILDRLGVPRRSARESHLVHEFDRAEAIRRYLDKEKPVQIARDMGIPVEWIYSEIQASRVPRFDPSTASRRYALDESVFDEITPESAYWIGFLAADGNVASDQNTISLSVQKRDGAHLEKLRVFMKSDCPIRDCWGTAPNGRKHPAKVIAITSLRLKLALAKFGVVPRKSYTMRVRLLEYNADFWAGVVDGDGCVTQSKGRPVIMLVGSLNLMRQFRRFVIGVCPEFRGAIHHRKETKACYAVNLKGQVAVAVAKALYDTDRVALDRKAKAARVIMGWRGRWRRRSKLTLKKLYEFHRRHGSWKDVAEHLDMKPQSLATLLLKRRKEAGRKQRPRKDWSAITIEHLEADREELGEWSKVAKKHGVKMGTLMDMVKKLRRRKRAMMLKSKYVDRYYATITEASAAARRLGIQSSTEYQRRYTEDPRLPYYQLTPKMYADAWVSWQDFLGRALKRRA